MTHTFAVNKTNTHVSLKGGYTVVPASGFLKVLKTDLEHPDFKDAFGREFIEYSDTEPVAVEVKGPTIMTSLSASQGMSEAELKEMLGNKEPEKSAVTVTLLGQGDDKTEPSEDLTSADKAEGTAGESTTPTKAGRKAK